MIVLLVIIYAAFISLGLPDSLLGSAWPSMYEGFGVPISYAGFISMIVAGGTIVSSLNSDRLIRRLGTGPVTLISVAMTAAALWGISFSDSFAMVCLCAVPLGLGAGSVDAALNNFVALHYKAAHMNWLHCFWGIGASTGPMVIAFFLTMQVTWKSGYRAVGVIQTALVLVLIISLPLWLKVKGNDSADDRKEKKSFGLFQLLKLKKAKPTLTAFFCYCSLEATVGLWGSSYLVMVRSVPGDVAARWISLYFLGITLGRLFSGFLSIWLNQRQMIRLGLVLIGVGVAGLLLPSNTVAMLGLFCIGLGCAPIFPSLLHETPRTFGEEHSQAIMGIQMASAYLGTTFMPPLFGAIASWTGYGLFPLYLSIFLLLMAVMVRMIYKGVMYS